MASGAPAPEGLEDLVEALRAAATKSLRHNGWFTEANVYDALATWGDALTKENLLAWRDREGGTREVNRHRVGIVMAGNIR